MEFCNFVQKILTLSVTYVKLQVTEHCNHDRGAVDHQYRGREAFAQAEAIGKGITAEGGRGARLSWADKVRLV